MTITQVKTLVNNATKEVLGESAILNEDLTNVVDLGETLFNANAVDAYVKSLVNHIGKVIFVDRVYKGGAPSVLMDGWEFGSVLEKIQCELPEASENESWELENGTSYDPNIFYQPEVSAKFFNKKVTFEIDMSFAEKQVKQSFSGAEQLNGFVSMLYNAVDKSLTVKIDSLIMRTINNMIGETVYDEYTSAQYTASSGIRAVNLLYMYNNGPNAGGTALTQAKAITDPDFLRYASLQMGLYAERMGKLSTLFNVGEKARFTPKDMLHVVLLSDFKRGAETYLYNANGQFKDEYLMLPSAETVPYWQGSGTGYAFADVSNVDIKTSGNHTVDIDGVIGVMFDRDALGVANIDRRTTTAYNAKGEFYNNFWKFDAGYFNDLNENFVVFFIK